MAELLFRLNGVSDDEADEVRLLLDDNSIDYYETDAGRFGLSVAAIWLPDKHQLKHARDLLDRYQQERQLRIREEYQQAASEGQVPTLLQRFIHDPFRFLLVVAAAGAILYLSIAPFVGML